MNPRSIAVVASLLLPLCACSGIRTRPKPGEETRLKVPYHSDRREQWGPAAVADVLSFWGRPVDLKAVRRGVRFTRKAEDVALDLEKAGTDHGFKAEMSKADLATIKRELDAGRPVIALVNTGFSWAPVRGYMVITGYSEHRRCIYAHWGPNKDFFVSYRQFETDWKKSGNWLLRIEGRKLAKAEPLPAINEQPDDISAPETARLPRADAALPSPPVEDPPMPELLWLAP